MAELSLTNAAHPDFPVSANPLPIGIVLPYIGPLDTLGSEWQPCDGRTITDNHSPMQGQVLPNLMNDTFLMGVRAADWVNRGGGSNTINADGGHSHGGQTNNLAGYMRGAINFDRGPERQDDFAPRWSIGQDGTHNHGGDNRPLFSGVYFIVKIK